MNRFRDKLLSSSLITTPATLVAGRMARRPMNEATALRHRGRESTERQTLGPSTERT